MSRLEVVLRGLVPQETLYAKAEKIRESYDRDPSLSLLKLEEIIGTSQSLVDLKQIQRSLVAESSAIE